MGKQTEIQAFFAKAKEYCAKVSGDKGGNCEGCGLREFCFTAPGSMEGRIIAAALDFLEQASQDDL